MTRELRALAAAAVVGGAAQAGPIGPYYVTAGDQGTNWTLQGTSATSFAQAHPGNLGEYGIAVSGDVRTIGNGNDQVNLGAQYTLAGVDTGTDYPYPLTGVLFYDGTTDGRYNYSVDYFAGLVWRMDRNWANPVPLFNTFFGGFHALGITYDSGTGTLWVSQWLGDGVFNFDLSGNVLSSFGTGFTNITSLGYDPADGTLWMGSQNTLGTFYQFSTGGTALGTQTYTALLGQNTLGGEFDINPGAVVPEPAGLSLLAAAVAVGAVRLRRKRTA
ncbi:MAG: PEP-CTERM sorting domain-containing protein [Gemmataceae bacterium]|nr:PEP-CTERM sorting domain-containing protein [Gemmataceae bacterium]